MLNINKILLSIVLAVSCIISFLLFDFSFLSESINQIIEAFTITLAGCYCAFSIAIKIDFDKVLTSGKDTALFCMICCILFYSLKGCEYSVTNNPFREFVFPISTLFFCSFSLIKIWVRPKKLRNKPKESSLNKKD